MPDEIDPTLPPKPPRTRRSRKFALPEHHHDERDGDRTDEGIEAFLTKRPARRLRPMPATRVRRPIELETRPDWLIALRHEAARQERYGRPASVLFIELAAPTDCAFAVADFDRIVVERTPQSFAERALYGRAACRARLGDEAGAKSDLAEYLRRFPAGRFASEARRRTIDGAKQ